ncbi:hypothetical protein Q4511_08845 [Paracoccus sp. 1_MG-2023]|uniref:hypothetical protein n=1 Tax=unclassified Paracoccus (in: a-proteobacteria) TaxID=2688777 RepID=UPI001C08C907|nr:MULTISPECIES: hypothetical protein [unclassified Paracoccus (in: a-proteobacteria)]MBU2959056.1 hypothetical protein [Paracoccus sp. C2R09]MDO6669029.1 hypothetical protein [Paracoccus sp. 1_MG-2023]
MAQYPRDIPTGRSGKPAGPIPGIRDERAFRGGQAAVWGGVALGVAGLTAATIMSVRRLTERPETRADTPTRHDTTPSEPVLAPGFAELTAEEREAIRQRVREQAREDYAAAARERVEASAKRNKRRKSNTAKDLTKTATELTASLTGVATAVAAASKAFRSVSGEAPGIMGEFVAAADQLRSMLNGSPNAQAGQNPDDRDTRRL